MPPVHYDKSQFPPPPNNLRWEILIPLLGPAAAAVARYDGMLAAVPNPSLLLAPLTTQEAVLSSRIEGTQATMGEVLEFEAGATEQNLSAAQEQDIGEVLNYRRAMLQAAQAMETLPLCLRVVREAHKTLMEDVRGHDKAPGEFRRVNNWIGPPGSTDTNARFVPVAPDFLQESLNRWERFLNDDFADRLVQLAIVHAEFEAIHPFLDGNGRIGRILIPLFLWQHKLIRQPMFYMSAYLESHRENYYERLLAVSRDADWTGWCQFFLRGVQHQAEINLERTGSILNLYESLKPTVAKETRSQYATLALDWMFTHPIFKGADFVTNAGIPEPTAKRLLAELKRAKILHELQKRSGRRSSVLVLGELLNVAEGRKIF